MATPVVALAQDGAPENVDPDDAAYRQAIDTAVQAYNEESWEEARAAFQKAHALRPSARTRRGLGLAAFMAGDVIAAMTDLEAALSDERSPLTSGQREEVEVFLAKARGMTARVGFDITPSPAQVKVDGAVITVAPGESIRLTAGEHAVDVSRDGYTPYTKTLLVHGGQEETFHWSLEPRARESKVVDTAQASGLRPWGWAALGGAPVFGALAVGVWIAGKSRVSDVEHDCQTAGGCTAADRDARLNAAHVGRFETWTALSLVAAGSCAATGAVILLTTTPRRSPSVTSIFVGPESMALGGTF